MKAARPRDMLKNALIQLTLDTEFCVHYLHTPERLPLCLARHLQPVTSAAPGRAMRATLKRVAISIVS
jgi:hypothetical protein